jgi:hypothetical protein
MCPAGAWAVGRIFYTFRIYIKSFPGEYEHSYSYNRDSLDEPPPPKYWLFLGEKSNEFDQFAENYGAMPLNKTTVRALESQKRNINYMERNLMVLH